MASKDFLDIGIVSAYDDINYLQFGIASPDELQDHSVCEVKSSSLKNDLEGTVYDPRMGMLGGKECQTCYNNTNVCPGHFGHIVLDVPVVHPKFFKTIVQILKCVCYSCSSLLITKEHAQLTGVLKYKNNDRLSHMIEKCQKEEACPACGDPRANYVVKDNKVKMYYNDKKKSSELTSQNIYNILTKITNDDFKMMGFNQHLSSNPIYKNEKTFVDEKMEHRHQSRPEWMMITVLPVLPPCARPYSFRDGEQHDDDLTDKYVSIVKANQKLKDQKTIGLLDDSEKTSTRKRGKLSESDRKKVIKDLEDNIKALFDNSDEKSKISGSRAHKGLKERLSSKKGHMRQNVMGKRVNFSARTVIGGDPTLELDQLGIPIQVATKLTKPEYVNKFNYDRIQQLVEDGKVNWIFRKGAQISVSTIKDKKSIKIHIGDVVERHLLDNDWVLFNRQPTLRIEGMMGFRVKVMPEGKTFRFNLSPTTAFNADYDGKLSLLSTGRLKRL